MTTTPEIVETPETQTDSALNAAAFSAGFSGEEDKAEPATPAIEETPESEAAQAVAEPEFISIKPDEWASVKAGLAELENLKRNTRTEFDKLGGKYGEINRALQQKPAGVKVSKEALDSIESDYPELGSKLRALFAGGDETPATAPGIDADEIERRVQEMRKPDLERINQLAIQQIDLGMKVYHRDWKKVRDEPAFEEWRKSLPEDEARQTAESNDVDFAAGQIDKYKAHKQALAEAEAAKAAKAQKLQNGQKRLEAASTPQGTARTGAPIKTEHDYFKEGFSS